MLYQNSKLRFRVAALLAPLVVEENAVPFAPVASPSTVHDEEDSDGTKKVFDSKWAETHGDGFASGSGKPEAKGKGRGFKQGVFKNVWKQNKRTFQWIGECGPESTWTTPSKDVYIRDWGCSEAAGVKCSKGYGKFVRTHSAPSATP